MAAALLVEQGFDVIGVTMQVWPEQKEPEGDFGGCCSMAAIEDARKVAAKLKIPHYVLNFRDIFADKVISDFCRQYLAGRTPNPCIRCNQHIKFDALLRRARELDADFVGTGHYARISYDESHGRYVMRKGVDLGKDQSYVLYVMGQDELAHTLMPLGDFLKEETRQLAADFGLSVAQKADSQEICFVPDNNYRDFLSEELRESLEPGPILDIEGRVLGTHQGIINYTIGQRKGLGLVSAEPLYVVEIDPINNALVVGPEKYLYSSALIAREVNWIAIDELTEPLKVKAKIRYSSPDFAAMVMPSGRGQLDVSFDTPQKAVTPGQAVVFYDGDTVVGGGTIHAALKAEVAA